MDEILGTPEPRYHTWQDLDGVTHVEVADLEHTTYFVKQGNKLVPSFDSDDGIVLGITNEL